MGRATFCLLLVLEGSRLKMSASRSCFIFQTGEFYLGYSNKSMVVGVLWFIVTSDLDSRYTPNYMRHFESDNLIDSAFLIRVSFLFCIEMMFKIYAFLFFFFEICLSNLLKSYYKLRKCYFTGLKSSRSSLLDYCGFNNSKEIKPQLRPLLHWQQYVCFCFYTNSISV